MERKVMIFIEYLWCFTFVPFEFFNTHENICYGFVPDYVRCYVHDESENMIGTINTKSKEKIFFSFK